MVEWPVVRHIRLLGNTVVELSALRGVLTTRLGQVLCGPQLQSDIRAIEQLYRDRGYVARVSERLLNDATESGILRFEILEVRIGEIQVEGGTPKQQERARAALHELPPNLYRPEDVSLDQRRLLRLPGIRSAVPSVSLASPGQVRILWRLNEDEGMEERKRGRVEVRASARHLILSSIHPLLLSSIHPLILSSSHPLFLSTGDPHPHQG